MKFSVKLEYMGDGSEAVRAGIEGGDRDNCLSLTAMAVGTGRRDALRLLEAQLRNLVEVASVEVSSVLSDDG